MTRILIVEDDAALADVLRYNLQQSGYDVEWARSGQDGLQLALKLLPQLVILDLMLPVLSGLEVCRRLRTDRRTKDTLILMLTAKSEEADQLIGFSMGADDYVTKPFSVQVLIQRIQALLRRGENFAGEKAVIEAHGIRLDGRRHVVTVEGKEVGLTRTEFGLLEVMIRQPGRAFRRSELIDGAMGRDTLVLERTIDVHIRSLRQKLGSAASAIQTVRGLGYRMRE